jgi:hypothetical protein
VNLLASRFNCRPRAVRRQGKRRTAIER